MRAASEAEKRWTRWAGGCNVEVGLAWERAGGSQMDSFRLTSTREAENIRLRLAGELDVATAPTLARAVFDAEGDEPPVLSFDLAELTFMDAAGLRVMLAAARRARLQGRHVEVLNPRTPIKRLLEITALDQSLDVTQEPELELKGDPAA